MKIKELTQLFGFRPLMSLHKGDVGDVFRERAELIFKLGKRIHQYRPNSIKAKVSVRDLTGGGFFENAGTVCDTQAGLFLNYGDSVDISEAYHDLCSLKLEDRAESLKYGVYKGPYPNAKILLETLNTGHLMMFHMNAGFFEGGMRNAEQKNELYVAGKGNPSLKRMGEIERLCKDRGATCEVKRSGKSGELSNGIGTMYCGYPHFFVKVKWPGSDFDKKAIHLYGDIRALVLDTHKRETLRNAKKELDRAYSFTEGRPDSVIINQESRNEGPVLSDLMCSLSSIVPFTYNNEPMEAHLFYPNFRGRG